MSGFRQPLADATPSSPIERALAGLSVGLGAAAVGLALFVALGRGQPHEVGRMLLALELLPLAAAGALLTAGVALAWYALSRDAAGSDRARRRALARIDANPFFDISPFARPADGATARLQPLAPDDPPKVPT